MAETMADTPASSPERLDPATLAELPGLLVAATLGEWSVLPLTSRDNAVNGAVRPIMGDDAWVAFVSGWPDDAPDEAEANARLIALAPELAAEVLRLRAGVDELATLVRMLARHVADDKQIKAKALDYLRRHGLMGSPLRAALAPDAPGQETARGAAEAELARLRAERDGEEGGNG